jgi:hypothetical protein
MPYEKVVNFLVQNRLYHCQLLTLTSIDSTMPITVGRSHELAVITHLHCRLCFHYRLKSRIGSDKLITTSSSTTNK